LESARRRRTEQARIEGRYEQTKGVPVVINEWQLAVEQVIVPATTNGARVLGFTSPSAGAGVTSFSRAVATTLARSGADVLYADLATPLRKSSPAHIRAANTPAWKEPLADREIGVQVTAPATLDARFYFNNVRWLRGEFVRMLRTHSNIVVDIPPVLNEQADRANAVAAAAACDAVAMIAVRSAVSQQDIARTLQMMSSTGVNLIGTVINEMNYTPPGEEMAVLAERWSPSARIGQYLSLKISGSELLR
jgi:Mrp family chromosome partitioning ATPase